MKKILFILSMLPFFASAAPSNIELSWTQELLREDGSVMVVTDIKQFDIFVQKPGSTGFVPAVTVLQSEQPGPVYTAIYIPDIIGAHIFKGVVTDIDGLVSVDSNAIQKVSIDSNTIQKVSIEDSPPKPSEFIITGTITITEVVN